ncbi:2,3-diphosphoglycerate-dependent phosphoglycerate mutase [Buchnera aphidicola (Formosaphis micheliae)]|uniref:2,3-diphosphoglycerate-dependent phosphoglycerate mutase n=1 Tax=Buchnera aphidicola TaxID=9 RepID=UPI0031B840C3
MNHKLILIRHGESEWNRLNKFTGWTDIDLSKNGKKEAIDAAKLLLLNKITVDLAYTSMLKRSIHTLWYILKYLDRSWIPVKKSWNLNERHYGALQGLNKLDTIKEYGAEQVQKWRRSFDETPPKLTPSDIRCPGNDIRYSNVEIDKLPMSESLESTINRVVDYWKIDILPNFKKNKKIIIVAHGNSLRALIKYLNKINNNDIVKLDIPTGTPIIYEFNKKFVPIKYFYLKDI